MSDETAAGEIGEHDFAVTASELDTATKRGRAPRGAWLRGRLLTALAAALLLSAVTAAAVYWWVYRTDLSTDLERQKEVLDAARSGTEAVLSYSPDTVDGDLNSAKSRLTGQFLQQYSDFANQIVVPAAKEKGVKTEANVARAAISQISPGKATVLAFVNQVTTSKDRPNPALATSSIMITLVKESGHWLISEFKPV